MESIRKALNKTSQVMHKLAQAGLTEELINSIINSPNNEMAEIMVSSISHKLRNKFLKEIYADKTAIVYKMYGPNACFEELFGSLCGHIKSENKADIPTLIKKIKENNLVFSSKDVGVDYIKSGVRNGIHKKGLTYFFAYLDEDGKIFVASAHVFSDGGVCVFVFHVSCDGVWDVCFDRRVVVPAKKILESKS